MRARRRIPTLPARWRVPTPAPRAWRRVWAHALKGRFRGPRNWLVSDAPSRPLSSGEVSRWDAEADVVGVGEGIAGGAAAIEAARAGARTLVLERV